MIHSFCQIFSQNIEMMEEEPAGNYTIDLLLSDNSRYNMSDCNVCVFHELKIALVDILVPHHNYKLLQ